MNYNKECTMTEHMRRARNERRDNAIKDIAGSFILVTSVSFAALGLLLWAVAVFA